VSEVASDTFQVTTPPPTAASWSSSGRPVSISGECVRDAIVYLPPPPPPSLCSGCLSRAVRAPPAQGRCCACTTCLAWSASWSLTWRSCCLEPSAGRAPVLRLCGCAANPDRSRTPAVDASSGCFVSRHREAAPPPPSPRSSLLQRGGSPAWYWEASGGWGGGGGGGDPVSGMDSPCYGCVPMSVSGAVFGKQGKQNAFEILETLGFLVYAEHS
jgi:hypothetical protein